MKHGYTIIQPTTLDGYTVTMESACGVQTSLHVTKTCTTQAITGSLHTAGDDSIWHYHTWQDVVWMHTDLLLQCMYTHMRILGKMDPHLCTCWEQKIVWWICCRDACGDGAIQGIVTIDPCWCWRLADGDNNVAWACVYVWVRESTHSDDDTACVKRSISDGLLVYVRSTILSEAK